MNWKILSSPTTATLTNPNSQSFCEIGKITQVTFKTSFQFPWLLNIYQLKKISTNKFSIRNFPFEPIGNSVPHNVLF